MRINKYEIFRGKNKQWYFHIVAKNGKLVAQSEGYRTKKGLYGGIKAAQNTKIIEV